MSESLQRFPKTLITRIDSPMTSRATALRVDSGRRSGLSVSSVRAVSRCVCTGPLGPSAGHVKPSLRNDQGATGGTEVPAARPRQRGGRMDHVGHSFQPAHSLAGVALPPLHRSISRPGVSSRFLNCGDDRGYPPRVNPSPALALQTKGWPGESHLPSPLLLPAASLLGQAQYSTLRGCVRSSN